MENELVFRSLFALMFILFVALRFYYGKQATKSETIVKAKSLTVDKIKVVFIVALPIATSAFTYILFPTWIGALAIELSTAWRWLGIGVGSAGILLYWWVLHTLGQQWSLYLVIKENHQLIDTGPYRWVRHPMYTVFFLFGLAFFLISANGFTAIAWLGIYAVILLRITGEESLLIEQFGDQYRFYMQKTGRFIPRWNVA